MSTGAIDTTHRTIDPYITNARDYANGRAGFTPAILVDVKSTLPDDADITYAAFNSLHASRATDNIRKMHLRANGLGKSLAKGFSLLEVIISILIIAILIGLLLPVFPSVTRSAKRRQATTQTIALVNAIKSYRTTYGRWPGQAGRSTNDTFYSSSNAVADMIAELTNNPRNIVFLDIPDSSLENNCMSDPWGQPYVVAFDADANGMLSCIISNGATSATLYRSNETAVVVSWGHKAADTESWIYSWSE